MRSDSTRTFIPNTMPATDGITTTSTGNPTYPEFAPPDPMASKAAAARGVRLMRRAHR